MRDILVEIIRLPSTLMEEAHTATFNFANLEFEGFNYSEDSIRGNL